MFPKQDTSPALVFWFPYLLLTFVPIANSFSKSVVNAYNGLAALLKAP
jgi:hypothetical protein